MKVAALVVAALVATPGVALAAGSTTAKPITATTKATTLPADPNALTFPDSQDKAPPGFLRRAGGALACL